MFKNLFGSRPSEPDPLEQWTRAVVQQCTGRSSEQLAALVNDVLTIGRQPNLHAGRLNATSLTYPVVNLVIAYWHSVSTSGKPIVLRLTSLALQSDLARTEILQVLRAKTEDPKMEETPFSHWEYEFQDIIGARRRRLGGSYPISTAFDTGAAPPGPIFVWIWCYASVVHNVILMTKQQQGIQPWMRDIAESIDRYFGTQAAEHFSQSEDQALRQVVLQIVEKQRALRSFLTL
jgi:hypothetical protein